MAIDLGDAVLTLGVDKRDFDASMKGIGASIKKHQKAIGIGMVAAGGTILAGLGMSLKAATDFESAMREVNTMMGLSQEEFMAFSGEVQALATDLGVDAVESAQALYQAISAGIPKENVLEFLRIATEAAIGGVTDTETAVDGLTTVINAFKLPMSDAQKVADLMFTTVKGGKTTFEELSAAMFNVAPIAAASGISFDEVSAALATMTKQGVPTKVATTQLRQAMVALQKPTTLMKKVIEELGYESGQLMVEELGLAATLNIMRDATDGNNAMLIEMFSSIEAGAAVLALTGDNAEAFVTDLEAMANAEGAAQEAADEMRKSLSFQMKELKEAGDGIAISIGNVLLPILKEFLDSVKPIIENIKNWVEENPKLTKVLVIGAAILGTVLTLMGGLLLILPGLIAALPLLGAAFTVLLGPIGLVILAIGAWTAAGIALQKDWDVIMRGIGRTTDTIINGIIEVINNLIKVINMIPGVDIDEIGKRGTPTQGLTQRSKDILAQQEIDKLATGGIVMKPMLTTIAQKGPEAVIPLSKLGMIGGVTVTGNNFYVRNDADINKIANAIVSKVRQKTGVKI